MRGRGARAAALAVTLSSLGCSDAKVRAAPTAEASSASPAPTGHVEWIALPASVDPASFVQRESARAAADGKKLVIYVGATWCEPCQRFHQAAAAGQLDTSLGGVRFIDLDHDAQAPAIEALGCGSRLIPLFSLPGADGRCTDRRVEGGIKGDGAVAFITPRLTTLLGL